jgi:hypothetical protein
MTRTHDIDADLRDLFRGHDSADARGRGRRLALVKVEDAYLGRAKRRHVPRRVVFVAAVVASLLVASVALAATTDFAQRVLGSKEPAVDRISVLHEDGPTMTDQELKDIFGREEVRAHVGDLLDNGHKVIEADGIRVSASATDKGEICMTVSEWDDGSNWPTRGWHTHGGGCGDLVDGWPVWDAAGASGTSGRFSYGLVVEGVSEVRYVVGDTTYRAKMGQSGFLWRHPAGVRMPDAIQAVLDDGTIVQREYPEPGVYAPPSDPHIVR